MSLHNGLLRSAHEIARRRGKDTNWDGFIMQLENALLQDAGITEVTKESMLTSATCTPKTFRL